MKMKLFYCEDHDAKWPVPVCSIIIAKDENQARDLLDEQLKERGLKTFSEEPYSLVKVPQQKPVAIVISDGEY